ncbi:hypothetical protein B0H10DRAFT_2119668 [Mycena sp. CBHHK59/15]|nr:hypothetical protein B0H10DRAFT_2119668 [Mycena sp. CBHHK59/15]
MSAISDLHVVSTLPQAGGRVSHSKESDATAGIDVISNLSPDLQERLAILTRVADVLGIDDLSFSSYSSAITRISLRTLDLQRSLNRFDLIERELQAHLATAVHEEQCIKGWIERIETEEATLESTSTIELKRGALLRKAKEYRAELDLIVTITPPITFANLTSQQAVNHARVQAIKVKRSKVKAFKGLPPNLELARLQLRTARAEQMNLIQLRERLLGKMADSVS